MSERNWQALETVLAAAPRSEFRIRLRNELERRARMLTMTGVREGFTTVTPYVTAVEIERLIAFAKEAFGAVETGRAPTGAGGVHCELRIGDSMLMFGGGDAARGREQPAMLHLYVPDCDAVYRQALKAGGESLGEPEEKPYGERQGGVKDSAGNLWYIATHHRPLDEGMRAVTPWLLPPIGRGLELIEFLKAAFGAREMGIYKSPDGKLLHAAVRIGDAVLEIGEPDPPRAGGAFYLYVPDCDAVYRQALEAGARPLSPPADHSYGDRSGGVEDAWGNTWWIASHLAG
jgi:PhnB protein